MKFGLIFYGIIFIAFGLGLELGKSVDEVVRGFWFLGLGFILLVISLFVKSEKEE